MSDGVKCSTCGAVLRLGTCACGRCGSAVLAQSRPVQGAASNLATSAIGVPAFERTVARSHLQSLDSAPITPTAPDEQLVPMVPPAAATLAPVLKAGVPHPAQNVQPAPQFSLIVAKHTAVILISFTRKRQVVGTFEQCRAAYIGAQVHNVIFGFWGILSFWLYNPISLFGNSGRYRTLRKQAATSRIP